MSEARRDGSRTRLGIRLAGLVLAVASAGCGVGSSSQGNGNDPNAPFDPTKDFYLTGGFFARPLFDVTGALTGIINPASLYETDPITGVVLPGFPKVLVPGTNIAALKSLNFEQILDPITPQIPLVPRNAALVLEFSKSIDASTLHLDNSDPANPGLITSSTSVQVRRKDGSLVTAAAQVDNNRIILYAVSGGAVGWDASPLEFDKFGTAVQDLTGFLRVVTGVGPTALKATSGAPLVSRPDNLGTEDVPLPFNPGNSKLDAIVLQTSSGVIKFNGFLPDLTAPRVIRPVELTDTIDAINFVSDGPTTFVEITGAVLSSPSNVVANGGKGEWANALLEVTGTGGKVTPYVVLKNVNEVAAPHRPVFRLVAGTVLDPSVVVSSSIHLTRSEFFEPIAPPLPNDPVLLASITVDPENHPRDPLDPQDLLNHDLRRFVRMFDEFGVERLDDWNPVTGLFLPVPPKTSLRLRFSEPMDVSSFRPYECFSVTDLVVAKTEPGFGQQHIGRATALAGSREIAFEPFLENQIQPEQSAFIGFGGSAASLKLVLRSLPDQDAIASIESNASAAQLAQLVDLDTVGVFGITDLGGRGLGLPPAMIDQGNTAHFLLQPTSTGRGAFPPAVDFEVAFQTQQTSDPDYGVIVHRFMGQPSTAVFTYPPGSIHDEVTSGAEYADYPPEDANGDGNIDRRFIYGPQIFDLGLNLPGRLTGAPATSIQHVMDDFNAPKNSPFASPNGEDQLLSVAFGSPNPLNSPFGARFQHIFRAGDASPSYNDFNGVVLDLVGLAWTPVGNVITNTTVQDMQILVGLSGANLGKGPDTNQQNGIPSDGFSGLGQQFDCNLLEWVTNCCKTNFMAPNLKKLIPTEPKMATVVKPGTPYTIAKAKLFAPGNAAGKPTGTFNLYLDYPTFNAGSDPIFGKTDVFSYPYDSQFPMVIEYRLKPSNGNVPAASLNFYRFSPAVLSSTLPRFRVWSQGQHPLARCVPSYGLGSITTPFICGFKGGEGGPLIEPGTHSLQIKPPVPNNGMLTIPPSSYILPPFNPSVPCPGTPFQPEPDATHPGFVPPFAPPPVVLPTCNTNPDMNWYFANGMFAYPLPNMVCYSGPSGLPPSTWYGYGPFNPFSAICPTTEPNYQCDPAEYGDNSRYFMMWKYRKRVSRIESPSIEAESTSGLVHYLLPIVDPPVASIDPAAGLVVEFKAGTQLDFQIPALDSGYVNQNDPDFESKLTGFGGTDQDRVFVKFRAAFAVANGQSQPPSIDTIVIPYIKVAP